jgi:hypothetical protein
MCYRIQRYTSPDISLLPSHAATPRPVPSHLSHSLLPSGHLEHRWVSRISPPRSPPGRSSVARSLSWQMVSVSSKKPHQRSATMTTRSYRAKEAVSSGRPRDHTFGEPPSVQLESAGTSSHLFQIMSATQP